MPDTEPAYMEGLRQALQNFEQCMRRHGATVTNFHQLVWAKWRGAESLREGACDPLVLRWLVESSEDTPSFVQTTMINAAELERIANDQRDMNSVDQFEYAQRYLGEHGLTVYFSGIQSDLPDDDSAGRSLANTIASAPDHYYYLLLTGEHRETKQVISHSLGVDTFDGMLFDPNGGIGRFGSKNLQRLGLAFCEWLRVGYPKLCFKHCRLLILH